MDSSSILTIVAVVLVLLAGLFIYTTVTGRDRRRAADASSGEAGDETADDTAKARQSSGREVERSAVGTVEASRSAPPAQWAPMDEETYGVTRRQFFNRSIVTMFGLGLTTFGSTTIAFLWPSLSGGFGSKIRVDEVSAILAKVADTREPVYVPEGRFYIAPFPKDAVDKAKGVYTGGVLAGMEAGVVALYQKCVHLGCRVPWCKASQWFECPCHGSQYNRVGEKKGGPAPRGMDRFPIAVSGGQVVVDTGQIIQGPPVGVNTTGQEAEGPHCA